MLVSAAAGSAGGALPGPTRLERVAEVATMLFPVWVSEKKKQCGSSVFPCLPQPPRPCVHSMLPAQALISGTTAFLRPATLSWMTTQQFELGVGVLMLAMGLSLTTDDFRKCAANPIPIVRCWAALCGHSADGAGRCNAMKNALAIISFIFTHAYNGLRVFMCSCWGLCANTPSSPALPSSSPSS